MVRYKNAHLESAVDLIFRPMIGSNTRMLQRHGVREYPKNEEINDRTDA
jgi:hypothetical protein